MHTGLVGTNVLRRDHFLMQELPLFTGGRSFRHSHINHTAISAQIAVCFGYTGEPISGQFTSNTRCVFFCHLVNTQNQFDDQSVLSRKCRKESVLAAARASAFS
ncbi:hypothetical protein RP75_05810 [Agrobacterium arsenijevicii]|uniref:Uncharacterized protein n=1 Tax=Agrobacterium arsenijevicii TaxID=1585697 RepID=A0ABR5DC78_9HYPH|nr:hypothetical protein RP75_05810 [Agrobacterium arsenijevicii]